MLFYQPGCVICVSLRTARCTGRFCSPYRCLCHALSDEFVFQVPTVSPFTFIENPNALVCMSIAKPLNIACAIYIVLRLDLGALLNITVGRYFALPISLKYFKTALTWIYVYFSKFFLSVFIIGTISYELCIFCSIPLVFYYQYYLITRKNRRKLYFTQSVKLKYHKLPNNHIKRANYLYSSFFLCYLYVIIPLQEFTCFSYYLLKIICGYYHLSCNLKVRLSNIREFYYNCHKKELKLHNHINVKQPTVIKTKVKICREILTQCNTCKLFDLHLITRFNGYVLLGHKPSIHSYFIIPYLNNNFIYLYLNITILHNAKYYFLITVDNKQYVCQFKIKYPLFKYKPLLVLLMNSLLLYYSILHMSNIILGQLLLFLNYGYIFCFTLDHLKNVVNGFTHFFIICILKYVIFLLKQILCVSYDVGNCFVPFYYIIIFMSSLFIFLVNIYSHFEFYDYKIILFLSSYSMLWINNG